MPVAIYPCNELWNLVPADPVFNQHVKRARLPGGARLEQARPALGATYALYGVRAALAGALAGDVAARFMGLAQAEDRGPGAIVAAVTGLVEHVAAARNVARF